MIRISIHLGNANPLFFYGVKWYNNYIIILQLLERVLGMKHNSATIKQITDIIASIDHLYEKWAKAFGFTLLEKQFFYILAENPSLSPTQAHMCEMMNSSKTTVNTIVKKMVKNGYIDLQLCADSKKEKEIFLTDKGQALIADMIYPLMAIEVSSVDTLSEAEIHIIVDGLTRYKNSLSEHINNRG